MEGGQGSRNHVLDVPLITTPLQFTYNEEKKHLGPVLKSRQLAAGKKLWLIQKYLTSNWFHRRVWKIRACDLYLK